MSSSPVFLSSHSTRLQQQRRRAKEITRKQKLFLLFEERARRRRFLFTFADILWNLNWSCVVWMAFITWKKEQERIINMPKVEKIFSAFRWNQRCFLRTAYALIVVELARIFVNRKKFNPLNSSQPGRSFLGGRQQKLISRKTMKFRALYKQPSSATHKKKI